MKWSSTAEQRVAGTLTGLLLDCGIQINHFYGLMIGKNMEFAKRLLLSDGGLLQLIGWKLLGALITLCTFGICYPWAFCMVYSWEAKHTVINGKRLQFNGTAVGLFGNWIKWLLLTFITCGIYSFWLVIALKKWKIKHTEFVK